MKQILMCKSVGQIYCKYSPAVVHLKKLVIASLEAHGRLNRFDAKVEQVWGT